jgi:hypothetical protein
MANVRNSNSIYVDATGSITTDPIKVTCIIFTPDSANDQLILKNFDNSGDIKISLRSATAKTTLIFDFSSAPIHFPKGVYVSTVTSNATATIVTTSGGG